MKTLYKIISILLACLTLMFSFSALASDNVLAGTVNKKGGTSGKTVYSSLNYPDKDYMSHYFLGRIRLLVPKNTGKFYPTVKLGIADSQKKTIYALTTPEGFSFPNSSKDAIYPSNKPYYEAVEGGNGHDYLASRKYCYLYKINDMPSNVSGTYYFALNDRLG